MAFETGTGAEGNGAGRVGEHKIQIEVKFRLRVIGVRAKVRKVDKIAMTLDVKIFDMEGFEFFR